MNKLRINTSPHSLSSLDNANTISATKKVSCLRTETHDIIYLNSYHTFGRSEANTVITKPHISRLHAIMFWQNSYWSVKDVSANGLWLNNKKILRDKPYLLHQDDVICFGGKRHHPFVLMNISSPKDILVANRSDIAPIFLNGFYTKISDLTYMAYGSKGWVYISYTENGITEMHLKNHDSIVLNDIEYKLQQNLIAPETKKMNPEVQLLTELIFKLKVSEDEENIELHLIHKDQTIVTKGSRLQNLLYLLLCLIRRTIEDEKQGFSPNNSGWLKVGEMANRLNIREANLRIRFHRLRDKLRQVLNFTKTDVCDLLQLQNSEIRCNSHQFIILKGNRLEYNYQITSNSPDISKRPQSARVSISEDCY